MHVSFLCKRKYKICTLLLQNYVRAPNKLFQWLLVAVLMNKVDSGRARSSGPIIKIRIGLFGVFCNFSLDNCAQLNVVE